MRKPVSLDGTLRGGPYDGRLYENLHPRANEMRIGYRGEGDPYIRVAVYRRAAGGLAFQDFEKDDPDTDPTTSAPWDAGFHISLVCVIQEPHLRTVGARRYGIECAQWILRARRIGLWAPIHVLCDPGTAAAIGDGLKRLSVLYGPVDIRVVDIPNGPMPGAIFGMRTSLPYHYADLPKGTRVIAFDVDSPPLRPFPDLASRLHEILDGGASYAGVYDAKHSVLKASQASGRARTLAPDEEWEATAREALSSDISLSDMPYPNCSVICFEVGNPKTTALFDAWNGEWSRWRQLDQLALGRTLNAFPPGTAGFAEPPGKRRRYNVAMITLFAAHVQRAMNPANAFLDVAVGMGHGLLHDLSICNGDVDRARDAAGAPRVNWRLARS